MALSVTGQCLLGPLDSKIVIFRRCPEITDLMTLSLVALHDVLPPLA